MGCIHYIDAMAKLLPSRFRSDLASPWPTDDFSYGFVGDVRTHDESCGARDAGTSNSKKKPAQPKKISVTMSLMPETRATLIHRLQTGTDQAAWSEFVEIYRPAIVRTYLLKRLQAADADDVAQKVLVAVSRNIGKWKQDPQRARFRTWLQRVVRNATINANGVQVSLVLPPSQTLAKANPFGDPQTFMRAMLMQQGAFEVTLHDDAGNTYYSTGSSGGGGFSGGNAGGFGGGFPNGINPNAQNQAPENAQTFGFAALPQDRKIQSVRVRMTERTGETKSILFKFETVSVPYDVQR